MLPNEKFALECLQRYAENGDIVDSTNGQFAHCPQPQKYGDSGYYLTWEDHQHQGILQSKDVGECCFFLGHAKKWLLECDCFPRNYFDLWDIYDEYASGHGKKVHEEKNENGKSVNAVKASNKAHAKKDSLGRSILGVKNSERLLAEKDDLGRSVNILKSLEIIHAEKDELGRSIQGVKNAERMNKKLHSRKNEEGKSIIGVEASRRNNLSVWQSTVDGFTSNLGNVVKHNKKNGWDPAARVKIS